MYAPFVLQRYWTSLWTLCGPRMENPMIAIDKRVSCRYGARATLCRYYEPHDGECMSVAACQAVKSHTAGFFNGSAARCRGFRDRTPSPIATQRDCLWDNYESMAKEIWRERANIRKTLTASPALVCEDCPEFLLPLSFRERLPYRAKG